MYIQSILRTVRTRGRASDGWHCQAEPGNEGTEPRVSVSGLLFGRKSKIRNPTSEIALPLQGTGGLLYSTPSVGWRLAG